MQDKDEDLFIEAIEVLRKNEPVHGYYGCFSGGKDSVVLKELAWLANVKVCWYYNQTTIDPPELVRFIRAEHSDVTWLKPKHGNFFRRLEEKGHIPTRRVRWCCDEYKERRTPKGTVLLMGIRAEESAARARSWSLVDTHKRTKRTVVLPMLNWDSEYLWQFIREQNLAMCSLYAEGFKRLGCIGCPLASKKARLREFERWPGFERRWKLSFRRVWTKRAGTLQNNGKEWFGSALFPDWQALWKWWLLNQRLPKSKD